MAQIFGIYRKVGRTFELIHLCTPSSFTVAPILSVSPLSLWHSRLGHVSFDGIRSLMSSGHLGLIKSDKVSCLSCQLKKQPELPYNKKYSISSTLFNIIHYDVWGLSPHNTVGDFKKFVIFSK